MSTPRLAPIIPDLKSCNPSDPNHQCPAAIYQAIAAILAGQDLMHNDIKENRDETKELAKLRSVDHEMLTELAAKMKYLAGNGNTDIEPVIPQMQRQIRENANFIRENEANIKALGGEKGVIKTVEFHARTQDKIEFRVGLIASGIGTVIGATGLAVLEYLKKKIGW